MVTATQSLTDDMIELFAAELGAEVRLVDPGEEQEAELQAKYFERRRRGGRGRRCGPARRSSPSWATSTTARRCCSTGSARPTWSPARPAASPSTSAPTRSSGSGHLITFIDTPGPRGVHRHARPRRRGDRHRRAGRGRRRRRHAPDGRGDQPRQGRRRADHRGHQQDRPRRRRPEPGHAAALRARPGPRGLGRRHDHGRGLRPAEPRHRRPARADRRSSPRSRSCKANPEGRARGIVLEAEPRHRPGPGGHGHRPARAPCGSATPSSPARPGARSRP